MAKITSAIKAIQTVKASNIKAGELAVITAIKDDYSSGNPHWRVGDFLTGITNGGVFNFRLSDYEYYSLVDIEVRLLEPGESITLTQESNLPVGPRDFAFTEAENAMMGDGVGKIPVIKAIRARLNWGLKETLDIVRAHYDARGWR